MLQRAFAAMLSLSVLIPHTGCMAPAQMRVRTESLARMASEKILQVTLMSGEVVQFDHHGARYYPKYRNHERVIVGRCEEGRFLVIELAQVREALVEGSSAADGNVDAFPALIFVGLALVVAVQRMQQ